MIRKQQYVRKSISNMTEGYDYYDTEILLNGIPVGGLSQHGYLGTAGFGPAPEDCYFNIPIPLQLKVEETVTMLPMEEIMKSVEQYVKEGKIGLFTEQDTAEETESTTIPVTKITILMKPKTESHTDLSGAFVALTSGKIPRTNRNCFT